MACQSVLHQKDLYRQNIYISHMNECKKDKMNRKK